jgi:hypothetical protein
MGSWLARQRTAHYELHLVWWNERSCYALKVFSRATGDLLDFYPLSGRRFPGFCRAPVADLTRWLRTIVTDMDVEMVIEARADPFYLEDEGAIRRYRMMRRRGEPISGRHDGQVERLLPSMFAGASKNPVGRRHSHRADFWDTPAGTATQVAAGLGVLAGIVYIATNWNSQTASYELPVATSTLLSSI